VSSNRTSIRASLVALLLVAMTVTSAAAFQPGIHMDISSEGLRPITAVVDGSRTIRFTEEALDEIADANKDTDIGPGFFVGPNHFTEEDFAASTARLLNLKQEVIDFVTRAEPDGETARRRLGTALHTLQDFYAHSNWIERGNTGPNATLGAGNLADPPLATATCPGNREMLPAGGGPILTSAYYSGLLGCGPIPAGKCVHGTPLLCDGINKDRPSQTGHFQARGIAVQASTDYVQSILDDPAVAGDDLAKKCLMGVANGTLGMVIDDTGSMGPEIGQVKNQVTQIVNRVRGTDEEPKQYLLVRFGDPSVGPPSTTSDPDVFLSRVNSLSPSGGGDCPELAFNGLLQAVGASRRESNLYFFSDASPKDPFLANAVITAARLKRVRINFLLTGTCSPLHPAYLDTAEQTGGLAFLLPSFQLPQAFALVEPSLEDDFVSVLLARDVLANDGRTYDVPVDSTIRRLVVSVSADRRDLVELRDPSGTPVVDGDPGVVVREIFSGTIITVETPAVGSWTLQVDGDGDLAVSVNANSSIDLLRFDFTELVNPIHEAYAPLAGLPVVGSTPTGLAKLLGEFGSADFELVDVTGAFLQPLALVLGDEFAAGDEFAGPVTPPAVPFRVAAVGIDDLGNPFRRVFPPVLRASTVGIAVDAAANPTGLPAGQTTHIAFEVSNVGADDTFLFQGSDSQGWVSGVTPISVVLAAGDSATVTVAVTVPAGAAEGTIDLISLVATSQSDPDVNNSAAIELPVVTNRPPDCSAAGDQPIELWPPNHKLVTVDVLTAAGVTDPDGDPVMVTVDGIRQDEPVSGLGAGDTAPDGRGLGTAVAEVRAERSGLGNGRVYQISFTADDGRGGTCEAIVPVEVPHSRNGEPAVDDGPAYDSTGS
jgi:hypothetical protein